MFRLKISDVLTTNWNLASSKISNVGTRNTTGSSPRVSIKISTSVSTNTSGNSPDVLFQISVFGAINQQQRAGLLVVWSGLGAEVSAPPMRKSAHVPETWMWLILRITYVWNIQNGLQKRTVPTFNSGDRAVGSTFLLVLQHLTDQCQNHHTTNRSEQQKTCWFWNGGTGTERLYLCSTHHSCAALCVCV